MGPAEAPPRRGAASAGASAPGRGHHARRPVVPARRWPGSAGLWRAQLGLRPGQKAGEWRHAFPDAIGLAPPPFARTAEAPEVPWERLGPIPIVAIAGGEGRDLAAHLVAAAIAEQGQSVRLATAADFQATREVLADPAATFAVVGLDDAGIAMRGLAFERCAYSAVVDLPTQLPAGIADSAELARALGVPMLVTHPEGAVALNADIPEIAALAEFAPCPIIYISTIGENATVGFHRASGGAALLCAMARWWRQKVLASSRSWLPTSHQRSSWARWPPCTLVDHGPELGADHRQRDGLSQPILKFFPIAP